MNRNILKRYDALKDEQMDIRRRAEKLEREMEQLASTQVTDTVMGTREDGTYGPIKIKGLPLPEYDQKREQLEQRLARYDEIEKELAGMIGSIEDFIMSVPDPRIRTILRLKYLDGKSWREIGQRYGRGPSWAFDKIKKYFSKK